MENQSLRSFLVCDFVLSSNGRQVSVSELEGKTVGLYLSSSSCESCIDFTPKLVEVYKELTARGEDFEVVLVSLDEQRRTFQQSFQTMPWLALPFASRSAAANQMRKLFQSIPALVIFEPNGTVLQHNYCINFAKDVGKYGVQAYPFARQNYLVAGNTEEEEEYPDYRFSWNHS